MFPTGFSQQFHETEVEDTSARYILVLILYFLVNLAIMHYISFKGGLPQTDIEMRLKTLKSMRLIYCMCLVTDSGS